MPRRFGPVALELRRAARDLASVRRLVGREFYVCRTEMCKKKMSAGPHISLLFYTALLG
jgi:hypothetical protein